MNPQQDSGEPPSKKQRSDSADDPLVKHDPVAMATTALTLQTVPSTLPTVDLNDPLGKGKALPRATVAITTGNVRPSLQSHTQSVTSDLVMKTQPVQSARISITNPQFITTQQYIPIQQTSDGTFTFQLTPGSYGSQPKSPVTPPTSMTLTSSGAPRYPSPQIITLPSRTTVANTTSAKPFKPTLTVVDARNQQPVQRVIQSDGGKPVEPVKLGPGQTQISFQVPLNWNTQGSKSLLDNSKTVSLVPLNPSETNSRSLLQGNETMTSQSGVANITVPKVTLSGVPNTAPKTYITGNKVFGNLGAGQVITQTTTGLIAVTKPGQTASIARIPKGSFMISNKQYTIVPSSTAPVVTQLVKTEKLSKGKVTMAEAQIMLPTGPAKISWPLQTQTCSSDSKHILITTPGQALAGKTAIPKTHLVVTTSDSNGKVSNISPAVPTAKVVEVGSPNKVAMATGIQAVGQKMNAPTNKTSIIPAQKNWELVKQSSQLLPGNSSKSPSPVVGNKNGSKVEDKVHKDTVTDVKQANDKHVKTDAEKKGKTLENKEKNVNKGRNEMDNSGLSKKQVSRSDSSNGIESKEFKEGIETTQNDNSNDSVEIKLENVKDNSEKMDVDDVNMESVKEEVNQGEGKDKKEDFNPMDAMIWNNGIGELPGSNLKLSS